MRYLYTAAITVALWAAAQSPVYGQVSIPSQPTSYVQVSQQYVTRSMSFFTYQAYLTNSGPALASVTATVSSLNPNVAVVSGQGTLHFAPVPANGRVLSSDSFTIQISGGLQFDPSYITWSFNSPTANPGVNQTVPVLSVVTLNGSASTNPGTGSLTYSWAIQSAPAGSTARLTNATSAIATFTPDLIGTFVIALTVSNGTQSDTNTVTISTTDAPPTANAGPNQSAPVGSQVTLDGTKSFAVNNQPLTFTWSFVSVPAGSTAFLYRLRSPNPTFQIDVAGTYILGLVVNDGTLSSSMATVTVSTGNTPPVAVATAQPQPVLVNGLVQLDGSKSTDFDGNPLTFSWTLNLSQAPGSKAVLSNPSIVNPTFTADVAGTYIAQLTVHDGIVASQAVTVTISTNTPGPPTANAGTNQKVAVTSLVHLQGSGTDPQNLPLTFKWTLSVVPTGSVAALSATNIPNPTFTADLPGTYTAQLVVSDGTLSSAPSFVNITSSVTPPVAVPTTALSSVPLQIPVLLNGSSSFDPDNDPITSYSWSLSAPSGSSATLNAANTAFASFVPDIPGTYVAQLIVKDAFATSVPATVSVSAGQMSITLSPNPLGLFNSPQPLTITVSPAAITPLPVTFSGFDPTVISLPGSVTVPANASSVNVIVTPINLGNTTIVANAVGYQAATAPVVVAVPKMTVTFDNNATFVGFNKSIGATITLSAPAPGPNGTSITLVDVQDHDSGNMPGLVTFTPDTVVIPPGATTGRFLVNGASIGPVEILPGSPGYARVNVIYFAVQ